jgi:hypothetical protein
MRAETSVRPTPDAGSDAGIVHILSLPIIHGKTPARSRTRATAARTRRGDGGSRARAPRPTKHYDFKEARQTSLTS